LLDLAAREDEHEKTFASMRANLADAERKTTVFDPEGQAALYLRAMADGYVFDIKADPIELFTGKEAMEKDSIAFYLGMKEFVPQRFGRDRLDGIIKEEMGHIAILSKDLRSLKEEQGPR